MGMYNNKGLYNTYDKKHKERDKLDFYATRPLEVLNILETLKLDFSNKTILENSCGQGHMLLSIDAYCEKNNQNAKIIGTDIRDRGFKADKIETYYGEEYDFLSDDYPIETADYIIMNPPFSTIEPFVLRSLEIAKKGIIMLGRLQFLEGSGRYQTIFSENPPTDVYVYIDRIQCYKDGNFEITGSSAQAYAWFYWDLQKSKETKLHWIHRR